MSPLNLFMANSLKLGCFSNEKRQPDRKKKRDSGLILEVSVISVPYLANIFGVIPLNAMGWIVVTVLSVMPLIIVELQKFVSSFVWRKD